MHALLRDFRVHSGASKSTEATTSEALIPRLNAQSKLASLNDNCGRAAAAVADRGHGDGLSVALERVEGAPDDAGARHACAWERGATERQ